MKASEIRDSLTIDQIFSLLEDLGGDPQMNDPFIKSRTICHNGENGGGKHKLDYNHDIKSFVCYTGCGSTFNIFDLVMKAKGVEFPEAINLIKSKFNIGFAGNQSLEVKIGFSPDNDTFYRAFKKRKVIRSEVEDLKNYNYEEATIGAFVEPHFEFINDGISPEVYVKRRVKYDLIRDQILIPHFDIDGNCIGIRARNLDPMRVNNGEKYIPYYRFGQSYKYNTRDHFYGLDSAQEDIQKYKTCILFEGEKSPMQLQTMKPDFNVGIATSGSVLSHEHIQLLLKLDINEVVIAYDKEFEKLGDVKEKLYAKKIQKSLVNRLAPFFRVSVIWDTGDYLDYKDSPTDAGIEVFDKLWESRIPLEYNDD